MPVNQEEQSSVNIIRGSIDSLTFYEVTEDELALLENGPSSSIYLNFAIGLLSICVSLFATIFTVKIDNNITFIVFLVVALVTLITGVGYLVTWFRSHKSFTAIIKRIKARTENKTKIIEIDDSSSNEIIVKE